VKTVEVYQEKTWTNDEPDERMTFWQWFASLFTPPKPDPIPIPPPSPAPFPPIPEPIVALFDAVNAARSANHLPPLLPDSKLDTLAQSWAATMARTGNLSHGDFEGRIDAIYRNRYAAENIALEPGNAHKVVLDWLASPNHRMNLLGDYQHVGCGHSGPYWVVDFLA
jgi:uncharacterized protein YkwD